MPLCSLNTQAQSQDPFPLCPCFILSHAWKPTIEKLYQYRPELIRVIQGT